MDRVDDDGVLLAEVIEEVGERGELPADSRRSHLLFLQRFAPGDDVGSGHDTKIGEVLDADELHELPNVVPIGPAGVGVGDVGEPFRLWRDVGQTLELRLGDETLFWGLARGRKMGTTNGFTGQLRRGWQGDPRGSRSSNNDGTVFGHGVGHPPGPEEKGIDRGSVKTRLSMWSRSRKSYLMG